MNNQKTEYYHTSVLLKETVECLSIKADGIYADGTLGGGGHAYEVCSKLSDKGKYIGIDQDEDAVNASRKRLDLYKDKIYIVRDNYKNIKNILTDLGITSVDGILLDLGVSSYQIDTRERGFSYNEDAKLDMRMDNRQEKTAKDIVNNYSEMELYKMIRDYGEDKFAKNIAKHIVSMRQKQPIDTTFQLNEAIKAAIPMKLRVKGGHPSKKTFQAIRIELNNELDVLKTVLSDMVGLLNEGGRLCIITFHSLEDRIVKQFFNKCEKPCTCPPNFPECICKKASLGIHITKKPILPKEEELLNNKRAKSAKLRVFERSNAQKTKYYNNSRSKYSNM